MSQRPDRQLAAEVAQSYLTGRLNRREMLKRAGALGISSAALNAALAARGVGAQATPSASPPQLGSYNGKTLKMSVALAEDEATVFTDVVVNGFKDATGGTIELVKLEATDVVKTLAAQVKSGNVQIDLMMQDNNTLGSLVSQQLVEPLPEAPQIIPPETIPALKGTFMFNNQYYFLPARPNVQITYYNSKSFDQFGVQTPKTWDELKSVASTIKDKAGVGKVSIQGVPGGPVGVTVTQFIWQAGGDPTKLNTPQAAQAFQLMHDLKPDLTPQYPTATFDTTNTYLLNESVVLAQNWPFGVAVIVDKGGKKEVKAYAGWAGPAGNVLVLGGDVFGVAKGSPNRAMALDVAKFVMTKDVQTKLVAQNAWPSMRTDALGSVPDWEQPYFQVVNEALNHTKPRPSLPYWTDIENILSDAFNDIVTNGKDVQSTLQSYQQQIDKLAAGGA